VGFTTFLPFAKATEEGSGRSALRHARGCRNGPLLARYGGMHRTEKSRGPGTTQRSPRGSEPKLRRLATRLRTLATEILQRIPEERGRGKGKTGALSTSAADQSPRKGYQWPASALTEDDMRTLHEIRTETDSPIAILVHDAVSALHALGNSNRVTLDRLRAQTGRSIQDLLGEAVSLLAERHAEVTADTGDKEPKHRLGLGRLRS